MTTTSIQCAQSRLSEAMPCPVCQTMNRQDATQESYADQIRIWCDGCGYPLKVLVPWIKTDRYGWHWQVDQERRTRLVDLAMTARRIVRWVVELFGDEWPDNGELSGAAIQDMARDYLRQTDCPRGAVAGLSNGDRTFLDSIARKIDAGDKVTTQEVERLLAMQERAA